MKSCFYSKLSQNLLTTNNPPLHDQEKYINKQKKTPASISVMFVFSLISFSNPP